MGRIRLFRSQKIDTDHGFAFQRFQSDFRIYHRFDGFFDFAVIKEDLGSMLTSISGDDFYFSFGPDLRVLMPQFPMRFMFANTFKFTNGKLDWRDTMKFVFSINLVNK